MASIDIRTSEDEMIDEIVFDSTNDYYTSCVCLKNGEVEYNGSTDYIVFSDEDEKVYVRKSAIPNLIKALQKAQEIWSNK